MPPKSKVRTNAANAAADAFVAKTLFELVQVHAALVGLSSRVTKLFHEVRRMPVHPDTQAALDRVKAAITAETDEIKTKVQQTIDAVNAGADQAEIVAQLNDISAAVSAVSDSLPTGPTPSTPAGPTG